MIAARVACASCAAFMADTITPVGGEDVPLCWICRHAVVVHGIPVAVAWDTICHHDEAGSLRSIEYVGSGDYKGRRCLCRRERFYPSDVLAARAAVPAPPELIAARAVAAARAARDAAAIAAIEIPPPTVDRLAWRDRLSFARRRA